jgi:uncharacterized membrane protein YheB (UPF0754 family)
MKKTYQFTIEFNVEVNDSVLTDEEEHNERMKTFLKTFIDDDNALLNYYALYFLDTVTLDEYHKELSELLGLPDEKVIMKEIANRNSDDVKRYILGLFDPDAPEAFQIRDNLRVAARDFFYNQFGGVTLKRAEMKEIAPD